MKEYKFSSKFITLLSPLIGGADCDVEAAKYRDLDPNNKIEVKKIIQNRLIPEFLKLSPIERKMVVQEAENDLACSETDFERLFYSGLPPFDAPNDPRDFFVWLLDEMKAAPSA